MKRKAKARFKLDYSRTYEPGEAQCGNCLMSSHKTCRPRRDITPCTCACPRAQEMRDAIELEIFSAYRRGEPVPTPKEALMRVLAGLKVQTK